MSCSSEFGEGITQSSPARGGIKQSFLVVLCHKADRFIQVMPVFLHAMIVNVIYEYDARNEKSLIPKQKKSGKKEKICLEILGAK